MSLFDWFADRRKTAPAVRNAQDVNEEDGLWSKCPECGLVVYRKDLAANASVCSGCGYHHRIFSEERIRLIADGGLVLIEGSLVVGPGAERGLVRAPRSSLIAAWTVTESESSR